MVEVYILKYLIRIRLVTCSYILLFIFSFNLSYGQDNDIDALKDLRSKYAKEILNAQNLLKEKGKSRINYLKQIELLNSKIKSQRNIIANYKKEITQIEGIIASNTILIEQLNSEIDVIKKGYEKLIIAAYRQSKDNSNEFIWLFSAKSFSEAYRRFNLMKQYSAYRKRQGLVLMETKARHDSIVDRNKTILAQKQESFKYLIDQTEYLKISSSAKEHYISELKKEESWLKEDISKKKKASSKLEKNIEKLIAESVDDSVEFSYSSFSKAKGKLNWPVDDGVVTSYFGEHNHAVLKGVKIKNNGIDIAVAKENDVKCVYEGTVSRIIAIPGYNKAVIVRHGKYLTVYANLVAVSVKNGDALKSKQAIGQIYSNDQDNSAILHFEIWEQNSKINPLDWLRP